MHAAALVVCPFVRPSVRLRLTVWVLAGLQHTAQHRGKEERTAAEGRERRKLNVMYVLHSHVFLWLGKENIFLLFWLAGIFFSRLNCSNNFLLIIFVSSFPSIILLFLSQFSINCLSSKSYWVLFLKMILIFNNLTPCHAYVCLSVRACVRVWASSLWP